jgi:protein SCO1/2
MSSRARIVLVAVAVIALGAAAAATLASRSDEDEPAAEVTELTPSGAEAPPSPFKGAQRPLARPRYFALHDQDGNLVRLRDLGGRVVILSGMYTTCTDTCPLTAQQIRAALDDLSEHERRQVVALALSVDPANDTPQSAKIFLVKRQVNRHLDFLLGTRRELEPVWRDYGFSPQTDEQEHNSYVVLIDRRGRQRVSFPVDFLTPESLAHDLRVLLRQRS